MRRLIPWMMVVLSAAAWAQQGARPISDASLGLSKGSVFDTPNPLVFDYEGGPPIVAQPSAFSPPLITHPIAGYTPITAGSNMCLSCHERPADIGKRADKGEPQAISRNHYLGSGKDVKLNRAFYDCLICHAPQANVQPLVGNSAK